MSNYILDLSVIVEEEECQAKKDLLAEEIIAFGRTLPGPAGESAGSVAKLVSCESRPYEARFFEEDQAVDGLEKPTIIMAELDVITEDPDQAEAELSEQVRVRLGLKNGPLIHRVVNAFAEPDFEFLPTEPVAGNGEIVRNVPSFVR